MIKFNLGCLFFVEYFVCVCINNFINLNDKIFIGIIFISIYYRILEDFVQNFYVYVYKVGCLNNVIV